MPPKKKKQKQTPASMRVAFGPALKAARERASVTQAALADLTGLTVSYLSMLENGKRGPTLDTVDEIAAALEISPRDLLGL